MADEIWSIDRVIGRNIRVLRDEVEELSQQKFVEVANSSLGTDWKDSMWSRWEKGEVAFRVRDVLVLARFLGVPVVRLLQPPENVTHVQVGPFIVPTSEYIADFFVDPRGAGQGIAVTRRLGDKTKWDLQRQLPRSERLEYYEDGTIHEFDDLQLGQAVGLKEHHARLKWYRENHDEHGIPRYSPEEHRQMLPEDQRKSLEKQLGIWEEGAVSGEQT